MRIGITMLLLLHFFYPALAQHPPKHAVVGLITDDKGEALAGVSVKATEEASGNSRLVVTNASGRFIFEELKEGEYSFLFTSVGYQNKQLKGYKVQADKTISLLIELQKQSSNLSDVVVVGYGTQKKISLTNSVTQLTGEELGRKQVNNIEQSLQGVAPGVTVIDNGGIPGRDNATIRVRGITTLSDNSALVIVDGIEQRLTDINPNDIESVTILKDAASTSIYGSRAANGVILITTKRGKAGKLTVNVNSSLSYQKTMNTPKNMNMRDYMELEATAYQNVGSAVPAMFTPDSITKWVNATDRYRYPLPNTWFKTLFHTAPRYDNNISVSGGSDNLKGRMAVRYMDQDGVTPNTSQNIREVRLNGDFKASSALSFSADINYRSNSNQTPHDLVGSVLDKMTTGSMWTVPKYPNGTYGLSNQSNNPLMYAEIGGKFKQTNDYLTGSIKGSWIIVKGLTLSSQFANRVNYFQSTDFTNAFTNTDSIKKITKLVQNNSLTEQRNYLYEYTWNNLLNYELTVGKHELKALAGYSEIYNKQNTISAYRERFYNNNIQSIGQGANDATKSNGGSNSEFGLRSYFGRVNYAFFKKYFIEANGRYDGSSRFTGDNKYSFFPSFSAGWRISQEGFFQPLKSIVEDVKLRASWGKTGNQAVPLYSYYSSLQSSIYTFGGQSVTGYASANFTNQDITWETTRQYDFGMDVTLLRNLTVTADYYNKRTSGILLQLPIPGLIGQNAPTQNAGVVDNKGIEVALSYKGSFGKSGRYSATGNFSYNKNTVVDLAGTGPYISSTNERDPRTITIVGQPIGAFWGYKTGGLFQTQDEVNSYPTYAVNTKPGDVKFLDRNKDGIISSDDDTIIGKSFPVYTFGLLTSVGWGGFDLNLQFQGVADVNTRLRGPINEQGNNEGFTHEIFTNNYWTPTHTDARFPRPTKGILNNMNTSDRTMLNGSYLRLKNVQLVYTIPVALVQKYKLQKASVFVSTTNLFTISELNEWNLDPETPSGNVNNYPQTRFTTIGINLQF